MPNQEPKSKPESAEQPIGEGLSSSVLFALADGWDAESAYLKKKADKAWHSSDNFDLKHQAETFDRCSRDLRKLLGAKRTGRKAIGFEIEKTFCEKAAGRLAEEMNFHQTNASDQATASKK